MPPAKRYSSMLSMESCAASGCADVIRYHKKKDGGGVSQDFWSDERSDGAGNAAGLTRRTGLRKGLLGVLLEVKHPLMSKLILALQGCVSDAKKALLYHQANGKDEDSKEGHPTTRRAAREMNRFKSLLEETRGFLSTVIITTYCRRMSRFVTEKVV
ncbi:hypothetical protein GCK32_013675 [Trichostrongylus colubriformis]|uniref:Uncharacterized protein n=1 Tax=Trichostrongylus colubriformis TaxID=6319 RepID=A0AAN8FRP6_TRICO